MENLEFDKIFVLDTNVLLHDSESIFKFEDNFVVIPIVVIEEVDHFKKGEGETSKNSRQVSRHLDDLRVKGDISKGIQLERGGYLKVDMFNHDCNGVDSLKEAIPDNKILGVAYRLKIQNPDKKVILISKDTNLRIKANVLGIFAEDYSSDKVANLDYMYTGVVVHYVEGEVINQLYSAKEVDVNMIPDLPKMYPNQYIVLKNMSSSQRGIARLDFKKNKLVALSDISKGVWGIKPKNLEQTIAFDMLLNDDIKLVTIVGKAGTGKTLIALASGLQKSLDDQLYKKLIVSRPIIPMGKDIGYLPGDVNEKMGPWLKPIFDNIEFLINGNSKTTKGVSVSGKDLMEQNMLEVEPLTYIRGRSIPFQFILLDEAQNLSNHEIKTIITRAGEGTKIVLTGDCEQIDSPYLDSLSNGLAYTVEKFKDQAIAAHITLIKGERSELAEIASNIL